MLLRSFFILLLLLAPRFASATLNQFLETYEANVYSTLKLIHQHAMTKQDRFLVLSATNGGYVQCLFRENDTKILCEAASGFYQTPRPNITTRELNILAGLDYRMDSRKGNFSMEIPMEGDATLHHVAKLMLETLYLGYGEEMHDFIITAPLVVQSLPRACRVSQVPQCESKGECEFNPKRLSFFVADFYKWYLAELQLMSQPEWHGCLSEEMAKRYTRNKAVEGHILRAALTDNFYAQLQTAKMNPLLLTKNFEKKYAQDVHARLTKNDGDKAQFIVALPIDSGEEGAALQLSVAMRVEKGLWKIDGVTRR